MTYKGSRSRFFCANMFINISFKKGRLHSKIFLVAIFALFVFSTFSTVCILSEKKSNENGLMKCRSHQEVVEQRPQPCSIQDSLEKQK